MDNSARLRFLFTKYLQRQSTPDEVEELIVHLQQAGAARELTEEMELLWEEIKKDKTRYNVDWDKMYSSVISKGEGTEVIIRQAYSGSYRYYYLIVFVFIILITLLIYWFLYHPVAGTNHSFSNTIHYPGQSYYLDNGGSDMNKGSKANPWKTIDKLNHTRLKPGDTIYFEGGQIFSGNILIDSADAGTDDQPIVITSSGNGKAVIDGGSATALTVYQTKFVSIYNLRLTGAGRKTGNTRDGVILNKCSNIVADNLEVRGFQKAGLLVNSSSDIEIRKVFSTENGAAGILVTGEWGKRDCKNIHISFCTAENNPGDPTNLTNHSGNGILAGLCKNVLIEYCSATNNGWDMPRKGNGPVGIWCYEADSIIIQHCISYKNRTAPGAADGGGFDIDGGVTNSVIQYCLSYENDGSGFGIFQYAGASNWNNNTIRYCISENDGSVSPAHAGVFIWNSSGDTNQFKNCYFYNNTIYNTKGAAISYERQSENTGFRFYNNIFVAKDSLVLGKETNSDYLGNNWYSLKSGFNIDGIKDFTEWANSNGKEKLNKKIAGLNINPMFNDPGNSVNILPSALTAYNSYRLSGNSVLRNSGIDLKKMFGIQTGNKDFNGTEAPSNGIGASF